MRIARNPIGLLLEIFLWVPPPFGRIMLMGLARATIHVEARPLQGKEDVVYRTPPAVAITTHTVPPAIVTQAKNVSAINYFLV